MTSITATAETKVKKKITWEDFTLKEHIQAYMGGVPKDCVIQIKPVIDDKVFRVNILNTKTETFVKSEAIRVITTPEGYIFEPWAKDHEKQNK